jgi:outer membrane immunogenic protein
MLSQCGAPSMAPRQGGRRVGPVMSLTAVSLLALVSAAAVAPAQAADLNGKVSSTQNEDEFGFRAPEVFNWSGVYVGAHLGTAWGDVNYSAMEGRVSHELDDGSLAGAHLGFNHQFGRWVGGAEVSLSGGDVGSSVEGDIDTKTEIDNLFLATVRLGYAFDRSLAYVKGGYASADVKFLADDGEFTSSERQAGFTLGAGFEYALTKALILGLEYNRVDLGDTTQVGFADGEAAPIRVEPDVLHVAMARLSIKFGEETAALPAMLK